MQLATSQGMLLVSLSGAGLCPTTQGTHILLAKLVLLQHAVVRRVGQEEYNVV